MEVDRELVELEPDRPGVGGVPQQQVGGRRHRHVAAVAPPVGHQALAGGEDGLDSGLGFEQPIAAVGGPSGPSAGRCVGVTRGVAAVEGRPRERGLRQPEHEHRPFEPAAHVEEPPPRPADHALAGEAGQGGQGHQHAVERLGGGERGQRRLLGQLVEHRGLLVEHRQQPPGAAREELAGAPGRGGGGAQAGGDRRQATGEGVAHLDVEVVGRPGRAEGHAAAGGPQRPGQARDVPGARVDAVDAGGEHHPGGGLGPLGVPARPVQGLGRPGRQRPPQVDLRSLGGGRHPRPRHRPEHPHVLAHALGPVGERAGRPGLQHPAVPAGEHHRAAGGEQHLRADGDRRGPQAPADQAGGGRHRHAGPGHVELGPLGHPVEPGGHAGVGEASQRHRRGQGGAEVVDGEVLGGRREPGPLVGVAAPQRLDGVEGQGPAGQEPAGGVEEGQQGRRLADRRAVGVGEVDALLALGADHAGHPLVAHQVVLDGVELALGEPPEQHVDLLQALQRPQPHPPPPHHDVGRLGHVVAQPGGQVGVLDVARLVGGAGQHHRAGAAAPGRGGGDQSRPQGGRVGPVGGHAQRPAVAGERPPDDRPGQQGVPVAGGHVGEVAQHPHLAVAVDDQVGADHVEPGRARAVPRGAQAGGVGGQRLDGDDAAAQQGAFPVEVGHDGRQHLGPLGQPGGDRCPRLLGDHQRDHVEPPRPQRVLGAVVEEDARALGQHLAVGGPLAPLELAGADGGDRLEDAAPAGPRPSPGVDGQVVAPGSAGARASREGVAGAEVAQAGLGVDRLAHGHCRFPAGRAGAARRQAPGDRGPEPAAAGRPVGPRRDPLS